MSLDERLAEPPDAHVRDPYGREIRSLRLSVTQRCDLACAHCHGEGQTPSADEMTALEIERLVRAGASIGIRKVKLTGGEPLLRDDIVDVISRISPLVNEVSLTTNGSRLQSLVQGLKNAGLDRVNVSLHTLDPLLYKRLCGREGCEDAIRGIRAATRSGLNPVKVNMVVFKDENDSEIMRMIEFCREVRATLQLIEYEHDGRGQSSSDFSKRFYSLGPVEEMIAGRSRSMSVNELHRRRRYTLGDNGTNVDVEFVRPMHNTEFCANCTRLRVTSNGRLKPCLLSSEGDVDVLAPLRSGATDSELRSLFLKAISNRRPYWS